MIEWVARSLAFMPHFHIPLQCGSDEVLRLMRRRYDTALFRHKIELIRSLIPDAFIGIDIIAGSRGETDEEFRRSVAFVESLPITRLHIFPYSERPGTVAARTMPDNVSEEVKIDRLNRMIALQNELSLEANRRDIGRTFAVLIEGVSKRSAEQWVGRTSQNKTVVFTRRPGQKVGDTVDVTIRDASSATLLGD